ncbi:hypothetical protein K493DRAFT_340070 [Basidiobolus meristosporus CBS 931.73]|uniref:Uncharacterized protein n=1 Tax=Basidiobolus meristosporus CBS 931.73 TaxID=1314790 RepID=A0A1Y1XX60_9FUNG|nr:hypothetical protein K493DRAFT_340070 [Basidiobolus meristosporus CBS 931.73]|eukprot:ORX90342.1 hypothetical protein K493DRAFT_340070 [Basidiobolus meristosporus CBS 931.73]
MLCESIVPQIFRPSPHFVERPQSPSVCFSAQPAPIKSFRSSPLICSSDDHQNSPILAPSPKKMTYRAGSFSSDCDDYFLGALPTLAEDSDEDSFDGDSISEHSDNSESNEAFAELFSIIHKPSSRFNEDQFDTEHFEESIDEQSSCDYFGRSPISRTQNPLPLDTMFYNGGSNASKVKVYNPSYYSATHKPSHVASPAFSKTTVDSQPMHLSFEKLRIRPRSHSVGAKPGKCGVIF